MVCFLVVALKIIMCRFWNDKKLWSISGPYISIEDIATFPDNSRFRSQHQSMIVKPVAREDADFKTPPPLATGIRPRQSSSNNILRVNLHSGHSTISAGKPPSSPTRLLANNQNDSLYTLPQKKSDENKHFRPVSPMLNAVNMSPKYNSGENFTFSDNKFQSNSTNSIASHASRNYENTSKLNCLRWKIKISGFSGAL